MNISRVGDTLEFRDDNSDAKVVFTVHEIRKMLPSLALIVGGDEQQSAPLSEFPLELQFGPPTQLVLKTPHGPVVSIPLDDQKILTLASGLLTGLSKSSRSDRETPVFEVPTIAMFDRPRWGLTMTEAGEAMFAFLVAPEGPSILYKLGPRDISMLREGLSAAGYLPK